MQLPPSCLPPAPAGADVPSATVPWHRGKCPSWGGIAHVASSKIPLLPSGFGGAAWDACEAVPICGQRSCSSPLALRRWCLGSFRRCSMGQARGERGAGWVLVGEGKRSHRGWENPSRGQRWVVNEPFGVPATRLGDPWICRAFFLLFPSSLSHFWVNAVAVRRDPVPRASPRCAKFCVSRKSLLCSAGLAATARGEGSPKRFRPLGTPHSSPRWLLGAIERSNYFCLVAFRVDRRVSVDASEFLL